MSEAKEGKLLGRKKLLDSHLGTTEGTKITSTIHFYTSHALTVYSNEQSHFNHIKATLYLTYPDIQAIPAKCT